MAPCNYVHLGKKIFISFFIGHIWWYLISLLKGSFINDVQLLGREGYVAIWYLLTKEKHLFGHLVTGGLNIPVFDDPDNETNTIGDKVLYSNVMKMICWYWYHHMCHCLSKHFIVSITSNWIQMWLYEAS